MDTCLTSLGCGQHAAFFYRSRYEQFSVSILFIKEGLARGERCLYVADDNSVGIVLKAMNAAGIETEQEQARGALRIATKYETFMRERTFKPQQMIDDLKAEVELSIKQGFTGFRGAGEMTWALTTPSACALLHEYEAALDQEFPVAFAGLCQYNENCFGPETISDILRVHPFIVARGQTVRNPFYCRGAASAKATLPWLDVEEVLLRATGI